MVPAARVVTDALMEAAGHMRVDDHRLGQRREAAQDRPHDSGAGHVRAPDIPRQVRRIAQAVRDQAEQVGMIEPGLHDVGPIAAQEADEARHPAWIDHAAANAKRLDRYAGAGNDRANRAHARHADHHRAEAAAIGSRVFVPCTDGLREVLVGPGDQLAVSWHAPRQVTGSPVVGGNTVYQA